MDSGVGARARLGSSGGVGQDSSQAACARRMAQVFEERPELRAQLLGMLADYHTRDDQALKLQVYYHPPQVTSRLLLSNA